MDEAAPETVRRGAGPEAAATEAELGDLLGRLTVEMLRETFDEWTIGETGGGLLAFRSGRFAAEGPESLKRACVMADTVEGLGERLCIQAWLESLNAADLEVVWREGIAAVRL